MIEAAVVLFLPSGTPIPLRIYASLERTCFSSFLLFFSSSSSIPIPLAHPDLIPPLLTPFVADTRMYYSFVLHDVIVFVSILYPFPSTNNL